MRKLLVLFVSGVLLPAWCFATEQVVTLSVPDMNCIQCLLRVKHSLLEVDGVERVEPDLGRREASVTIDDNEASALELVEAVREAGYESSVIHTYTPRPTDN